MDKRFPLELAGIAYRLGDPATAERHLRRALRLDPSDEYGNDFLATLYYLDGNYEAALVYWNRIGKPFISSVVVDPPAPIRAVLLDRALRFAPGEMLTVRKYRATRASLEALDVFNRVRIELASHPGQRVEPQINWVAPTRWSTALSTFGDLGFQALDLNLRNLARRAVSWETFWRWDAQKRRLSSSVSAPLSGDARWRWKLFADARAETWNLGAPEDFRLRKEEVGAELRSLATDRLSWSTAFYVATRRFTGAPQLSSGFSAKYRAAADYRLLTIPEKKLDINISGLSEFGRLVSRSDGLFGRVQASLNARWLPTSERQDYETSLRIGSGNVFGQAPFDELFILGLERDNNLPLRGHVGTRDGKKGITPIGNRYFLVNLDFFKRAYHGAWLSLDAGPALDIGRMWDTLPGSATGKLSIDAGVQLRLRILGNFTILLSYGRDLRDGRNAFYSYPIR